VQKLACLGSNPLEYGKRALVFDVRGIKNGNGDLGAGSTNKQYRASLSYVGEVRTEIRQFLDILQFHEGKRIV
jgi:hypothetical protein